MKLSKLASILQEGKNTIPPELKFANSVLAREYIDQLDYDDVVQEDVTDIFGNIYLEKGDSKRQYNWASWGFDKRNVKYNTDGSLNINKVNRPVQIQYLVSYDRKKLDGAKVLPEKFYRINGDFICAGLELRNLSGSPRIVANGYFFAYDNDLTDDSLPLLPEYVDGELDISNNRFESLHNIHKYVKYIGANIILTDNLIEGNVLGLLFIEGLRAVTYDASGKISKKAVRAEKAFDIINIHLHKGKEGLFDCQQQMIDEGLEEFAQL